jgi:hypothetical protein
MMLPLSKRNQQTGQVNAPFGFGLAKARSLAGAAGVSTDDSWDEVSGWGTENLVLQRGQSAIVPAISSSALSL